MEWVSDPVKALNGGKIKVATVANGWYDNNHCWNLDVRTYPEGMFDSYPNWETFDTGGKIVREYTLNSSLTPVPGGYVKVITCDDIYGPESWETKSKESATLTIPVLKVKLRAWDLDNQEASDADKGGIGVFVHCNLDNDNYSDNTNGLPKHPGADYNEFYSIPPTPTHPYAEPEDDLKALIMVLQPADLNMGSITLMVQTPNVRIWKSPTKDGEDNILIDNYGPNEVTWNLANSIERNEFWALSDSLYVEGTGNGDSFVQIIYYGPRGNRVADDLVRYRIVSANCGRQPFTEPDVMMTALSEVTPTPFWYNDEREYYKETLFPNLKHCEWSIVNEQDATYNCIAWSVGNDQFWYTPQDIDINFGDYDYVFENDDMDMFYYNYNDQHWSRIPIYGELEDRAAEAKAMYYPLESDWDYINNPNPPSRGYHGAKRHEVQDCSMEQKRVMYESKCGNTAKIEHVWDQLDDSDYSIPGNIKIFYK